jgi:hypothetical protein
MKTEEKMKVQSRAKKRTPYSHIFRLSHWILAFGMLFLILSGYGIHSVSMPSWSIFDKYPSFYPAFRTIHWHKIAAIIFAPASIVALVSFLPKIRRMQTSSLRKTTNTILVLSGVVSAVTGTGLVFSDMPVSVYLICRFLHAFFGMLVIPVSLLIHIVLALFKYWRLLVPSFAPIRQGRWIQTGWLVLGLALSWCLFTRMIPTQMGLNEITVKKVDRMIQRADQLELLPWETADFLGVRLANGVGFRAGTTRADIRALYNDRYLYMKIGWEDATYNRLFRPWIKTDTGWMHLNPGGSDEKIYNEDKLALLFPIRKTGDFQKFGCSTFCHNNDKNNFGMHSPPPECLVDVWHWKSVRTDPLGHADDKYWLGSGEITPDTEARYGDPGESGYANNMVEGVSNPIMLPSGSDSVLMGALVLSRSEIYTKSASEKMAVGSAVPGVIVSEMQGDRADILCRSIYQEGMWTVYLARKLDTGSPYDVLFQPGGEYDFALAAFDHSSFRHAYNHKSCRLVFEE